MRYMRTSSSAMLLGSRAVSAIKPGMKRHHPEDDRNDENIVRQSRDANQYYAVPHHAQNQHADDGTDNSASPAGQRRTADDIHGDDLQFIAGTAIGVRRRNPDRTGNSGVGGDDRRQDEQ